jgi:hypothetical protein
MTALAKIIIAAFLGIINPGTDDKSVNGSNTAILKPQTTNHLHIEEEISETCHSKIFIN